jgi:hypothetical protein
LKTEEGVCQSTCQAIIVDQMKRGSRICSPSQVHHSCDGELQAVQQIPNGYHVDDSAAMYKVKMIAA